MTFIGPLDDQVFLVANSFSFVKGTLDQFDYPKKGKNIPPSKYDAPPREDPEDDQQEAGSYYDEHGNRVEQQEDYGDEGQNDGYGDEQAYGEEGQQQDYGDEGYGEEAAQDYGEEGQ